MPDLTQLTIEELVIYPIKSCAGISVTELTFDHQGPTQDRRYMLITNEGRFVTQRQCPAMAWIQPQLTDAGLLLSFPDASDILVVEPDDNATRLTVTVWRDQVDALDAGDSVASWLSQVLDREVRLVFMPDDSVRKIDPDYSEKGEQVSFADGFPLLVTHQSSLDFLSEALGRELDMARFRPNVVVSGGEAFDELQWQWLSPLVSGVGADSASGKQGIALVKPCERCVIPTRDIKTQSREADVMDVLKQHCRPESRILFGQNGILRGLTTLYMGQQLVVSGVVGS